VAEAAMFNLTHKAHAQFLIIRLSYHNHYKTRDVTNTQNTLNTQTHTYYTFNTHKHTHTHKILQVKWLPMITKHPFEPVSKHGLTHSCREVSH